MNTLPSIITSFLCLSFFCLNNSFAQHKTIKEITSIQDKTELIAALLDSRVHFQKDTTSLIKHLDSLKILARERQSIPMKWAYYMLMADGFSIAFDSTNPRSDFYFNKADELLKNRTENELLFLSAIRRGYYHFVYREVKQAFPFFLQVGEIQKSVDPRQVPKATLHYGYIASFFSYIGDQKRAVNSLKTALPMAEPLSRKKIDMVNAIGVYLKKDSLYDDANFYYNQALQIATQAKDSVWMGIIAGNLSELEWKKGNQEKAIALLKDNIALATKYDEFKDAMRANLELAKIYIIRKQWRLARTALLKSQGLMENKPYFLPYYTDAFKARAAIAKGLGNKDIELDNLHLYIQYRDSLAKQTNYDNLQKIYWQWEADKYLQTLEEDEIKREQINQTYQYAGVFLILVFVIILLLINRSRGKILIHTAMLENKQLAMTYEKQLVDQEVLVLKDSLKEFTDTIKNNDITIGLLRGELKNQPLISADQEEHISNNLNALLESHIMTDERWIKFKYVFDKVYPGYLSDQKKKQPALSENDLRIIALTKLELSNRSMSDLLGVSVEGVKKAKQRMKKKIAALASIV